MKTEALTGKALYRSVSFECSKVMTHRYSTSFSLGIRSLNARYRDPIYGIYGYVRLADEIVDSFHGHDKAAMLQRLLIRDFVIVDRLELEFTSGFGALTGETGAGTADSVPACGGVSTPASFRTSSTA